MKHFLKTFPFIIVFMATAVVVGIFTPLPVIHSDFMSLYHALLGWSRGASIYDFALQQSLMFKTQPGFSIALYPYFPYPPWYAGTFFFLSYLSFEQAYRAWLFINLGMLVCSAILLTSGQASRIRLIAIVLFVLYFPSLGLLLVGNYGLPVILGGALFIYAVRKEDTWLTAAGLALMTYKPHIGLFMILSGVLFLLRQKPELVKRVFWKTIATGGVLALIGFFIEPAWLVSFPKSIFSWQSSGYIDQCGYCAGSGNMLMRLVDDQAGPASARLVSLVLLAAAGTAIWLRREQLFSRPETAISIGACLTAIASPYMVNYDYVLLLIPLMILFTLDDRKRTQVLLGLAYVLPWFGLFLSRTGGNALLLGTDLVLFFVLFYFNPARAAESIHAEG